MILHYLKIALRNMWRFKLQTIVCFTGLAVGMTCFALGTLWLRFIESFEDFVPDKENVYYVTSGQKETGRGFNYYTYKASGQDLQDSIAAIDAHCSILYYIEKGERNTIGLAAESSKATNGGSILANVAEVDSLFFPFFSVEALWGSVARLMPGDIVLTESAAKRLFGNAAEAVGKTLTKTKCTRDEELVEQSDRKVDLKVSIRRSYTVSAVVKDCPRNTQFHYDALLPYSELTLQAKEYGQFCTFVRMNKNARTDSIVGVPFKLTVNTPMEGYPDINIVREREYELVPITQLRADYPTEFIDIKTEFVRWFMLIGVLVIVCSLCNYLITMTSHLRRRGWEFSLRRVLGSSRIHIIYMVCLETLLTFILATLLGFLLIMIVLPYFREYSGIELPMSDIAARLTVYLLLVIAGGMALSALTAILVMRKTQRDILSSRQLSHSSPLLDRAGIIVQMALSMGIIFALVIILRQVNFLMYSDEIGFHRENIGVVLSPSEEVRAKLRQTPMVDELLENYVEMFPHYFTYDIKLRHQIDNSDGEFDAELFHIDNAYARLYGFLLVAGHLPEQGKFKGESFTIKELDYLTLLENGQIQVNYVESVHYPMEVCINEAMCRTLGVKPKQAIGKKLFYPIGRDRGYDEFRIVGVLKDMHNLGPTIQPQPAVYRHWEEKHVGGSVIFRSQPGRIKELCDSIHQWGEENGTPVNIINCEAEYAKYVASEQMLIKILFAVGGASLFVCVIGTFSLVSLSLQQRRKEIAIRKVHGAKTKDILRLFMRSHIISLCLAAIIAYPIAYIIMKQWLEHYPKQVGIDWWPILTTFFVIATLVLATITLKIWRAARESTVEALNN